MSGQRRGILGRWFLLGAGLGGAAGCGAGASTPRSGEVAASRAGMAPPPTAAAGEASESEPPRADAGPPGRPGASDDSPGSVLVGEILGTKAFDPRPVLEARKPAWLDCYREARQSNPALHGKLRLHLQVDESGAVVHVGVESGGANDPDLVGCLRDDLTQHVHFSRPGGSATVVAPLVFRR